MKSIEEIKAKLNKLFAMAAPDSGASQQEIETALTKARKLLAEYKLSEGDLVDNIKSEVISKSFSDITFSSQKNYWILNLLNTIADNHCCHACVYTTYGAKVKTAGLIGFEEDVDIAGGILRYALECIFSETDKLRRKAVRRGYTTKEATAMCNAYGNGYVRGIEEAFKEQNLKETEVSESFALVMTTPTEVNDYVSSKCSRSSFNTSKANYAARQYDDLAAKGYLDGKEFNMRSRLAG